VSRPGDTWVLASRDPLLVHLPGSSAGDDGGLVCRVQLRKLVFAHSSVFVMLSRHAISGAHGSWA
jgi:hypothetical protein